MLNIVKFIGGLLRLVAHGSGIDSGNGRANGTPTTSPGYDFERETFERRRAMMYRRRAAGLPSYQPPGKYTR